MRANVYVELRFTVSVPVETTIEASGSGSYYEDSESVSAQAIEVAERIRLMTNYPFDLESATVIDWEEVYA